MVLLVCHLFGYSHLPYRALYKQNTTDRGHPGNQTFYLFSPLVLLSLASVYQVLLLYDTLAHRNTIQLIGLCVYSALLCVYAVLQIHQVDLLAEEYNEVVQFRPLPRSIGVVTGAFTAIICAVS